MSNDRPKRIDAASPLVPFDERVTSEWHKIRRGGRTEPITQSNVSSVVDPQRVAVNRSEEPEDTNSTQPILDGNVLADNGA